MSKSKTIVIDELGDYDGTLGELEIIVKKLIVQYGPDAKINFEAWPYNCSVEVTRDEFFEQSRKTAKKLDSK